MDEVDQESGLRSVAASSTELLETFLALMPDAAVVVDANGVIVSINEHASNLFGYSPEELAGRPVEILVPERSRVRHRQVRANYQNVPRTRPMGAGLELTGRHRDGREVPVDISLAPIGTSEAPLVLAAVRDVSERRAAHHAQAQLASIVENSLDAILSITLEGLVTTWNPGAERILGYTADEMVGSHVSRLIPDESSVVLEELLDAALRDAGPTPRDTEWLRPDGTRLSVAISVSPMRGPAGESIGFSVLLRDISERKRAEAELRQLLVQVTRQERWQAATADIRLALLSSTAPQEVLSLICERLLELLAATAVAVVPGEEPHRVRAAAGRAASLNGELVGAAPALLREAFDAGATLAVESAGTAEIGGRSLTDVFGGGPLLVVPVVSGQRVEAVVLVGRSQNAPYSPWDVEVAESLAAQSAMALELARARADGERLLLAEERERIGRDLHDVVIQRLFAAGIGLQSVTRLIDNAKAATRVSEVVEELDTTIRDIRTAIFSLAVTHTATGGVRADVLGLAEEASRALGFQPSARFDGPVDAKVSADIAQHVTAVVREALSNIARHAQATSAFVELIAGDDLVVIISDDGVGPGPLTRQSGLANLRSRAENLGGTFEIASAAGERGTRIEWRIPLSSHGSS